MALKIAKTVEEGRVAVEYHKISRVRHNGDTITFKLASYVDEKDRAKNPPIGDPFDVTVQLVIRGEHEEVVRYDTVDGKEVPITAMVPNEVVYVEAALEPAETLYQRYYQLVKTDPDWQAAEDLL